MSAKPFRRKDLKHDEFIDATGRATRWLLAHRRRIGWALLAVVLVVSVVFSVRLVHQRQEDSAAALLALAMEIYRAPVIPPAPEVTVAPIANEGETAATDEPSAPAGAAAPEVAGATTEERTTGSPEGSEEEAPSVATEGSLEDPAPISEPLFTGLQFASAEEKYRAALERFEPIVDRYPSRPSGRVAAFYIGDCHSQLGDTDAAIAAFTQAAEAGGSLVSSMALYRLGQLARDLGNAEGAVAYFDRLLETPGSLFPRGEALMAKAGAYEEGGDQRAALAAYQQVLDDFGDSYVAVEARRHVEELSARLGLDPNVEGD